MDSADDKQQRLITSGDQSTDMLNTTTQGSGSNAVATGAINQSIFDESQITEEPSFYYPREAPEQLAPSGSN